MQMPFEELYELLKKVLIYVEMQSNLKKHYKTTIDDYFRVNIDSTYYDIECYYNDKEDTYKFNLVIRDTVCKKNKSTSIFNQLYYDPDGNFSLENNKSVLFEYDEICEWLTEETFFQQSTVIDFGNTDLQYWKKCMKILDQIYWESIDVHN